MADQSNESTAGERCFKIIAETSAPPILQNGKIVLQTYHIGFIISGSLALIAIFTSFWLISKHLQWYTNKREQRYIVRILFMVPLYAVISFLSFLFWNHATPIILVRDAYEAIVLTAFFYLLLMYISHDTEEQKKVFVKAGLSREADAIAKQKGQEVARWVLPLGFLKWKPKDGLYFLQLMKWGVLQYCVVRPTTTFAAVILNYVGLYCEDSWGLGWGHIYITVIMSLSVTVAMYCLIQLYVPVAKELAPHKPLLKLFSIKAVVFLTFWQATFLSLLSTFGIVKNTKYMTAEDVNTGIGAIIECLEMMIFGFLHILAFTYKPYAEQPSKGFYPSKTPQWRSLGHAMDFRETFREIWVGCVYMFDHIRGREPTPDFGVIRETHYEGAFGRPRQAQRRPEASLPQDQKSYRAADIIYPSVQVEVDRKVEVDVNGYRQWLMDEKDRQRIMHPKREKSEGLQEQINKELEKRMRYSNDENDANIRPYEDLQPGGQRTWWRSIYNRISQSGHGLEEEDPQSSNQIKLSRWRSSRLHSQHLRNDTLRPKSFDRDNDEQPPPNVLHSPNARPSRSSVAYQEHDKDRHFYLQADDRLPSSPNDDLRRVAYQPKDRPPVGLPRIFPEHAHSSGHVASRLPSGWHRIDSLPPSAKPERSSPLLSYGGADGPRGPKALVIPIMPLRLAKPDPETRDGAQYAPYPWTPPPLKDTPEPASLHQRQDHVFEHNQHHNSLHRRDPEVIPAHQQNCSREPQNLVRSRYEDLAFPEFVEGSTRTPQLQHAAQPMNYDTTFDDQAL